MLAIFRFRCARCFDTDGWELKKRRAEPYRGRTERWFGLALDAGDDLPIGR